MMLHPLQALQTLQTRRPRPASCLCRHIAVSLNPCKRHNVYIPYFLRLKDPCPLYAAPNGYNSLFLVQILLIIERSDRPRAQGHILQ